MSHQRFARIVAISTASAALVLLSACGSSSESAPSAVPAEQKAVQSGPVNPCDLLTVEEVSAAAGQPMLAGELDKGSNPFGQTMCAWEAQKQGSVLIVQVSVMREADFAGQMKKTYSAKKLYDQAMTLYPNATGVAGVGNEAFRSDNTLQVLADGGVTFTVMVGLPGRHTVADETLVALARTIESRLD